MNMYLEPATEPQFPPENTNEPDWFDWCDEIYQFYNDERYEDEFIRDHV